MYKTLYGLLVFLVAASSAFSAELNIQPDASSVTVDVKASPPHSFTCDLLNFNASVDLDPVGESVNSATFTFMLTDLETHNDKRNKKMIGWMDVDKYNAISWAMTSVEQVDGKAIAHGQMTMHGVTLPVDIPFVLSKEGNTFTITGEADFNYMEFDLPKIRLLIFTVNPELHVNFKLQGILASAG